ncbi:winged helix-turn-helix transcriptional regulator [Candidatus Falkowbacteria bacterium]|nr:winged helix-turn-helix transcriptional regulator [Candidatus Falkowbacteria bacterium]
MLLTQELLTVGLNSKEAEVYIAALQLGYSSVQEIAEKSGINRTTAYTHIKNLISRGLLNAVERNGKIYYVAEKPEKLKFIHEQQEKEVSRRREILEKIMPELESIYNLAKDKPSVRYFDYGNPANLEYVRQEIVNRRFPEMQNIFNWEIFHDHISRAHIQRLLTGIDKLKVLYIAKNKMIDYRIIPLLETRKVEVKFLPEAKFGFLCEVLIAGDMVYISRVSDGLIITDKLFSQTLRLVFQALWGIAEDFRRD